MATATLPATAEIHQITACIDAFFTERLAAASHLGVRYGQLWAAARDAAIGGKKHRPVLVLSTYRELSASQGEPADASVVRVASALELLHTAFLLHDDVLDGDFMRRGRPNLAGLFATGAEGQGLDRERSAQWGQASAILAGDLLIHAAQRMIVDIEVPEARRFDLLDLLSESIFVTAAGELADVAFSLHVEHADLGQVLEMCEMKTANYSFSTPLKAGAILAGAAPETVRSLGEIGRLIGIAFQLRDDELGVFGSPEVTGKSVMTDLRCGKMTPLIAYARTTSQWNAISGLLGRAELTESDGVVLRGALEQCGARRFVEDMIDDYVRSAIERAESAHLPAELQRQLTEIARFAADRSA